MSFQDETDRERRRKAESEVPENSGQTKPKRRRGQSADVGDALRTVYQRTVSEDIPPDLLDLLGKLD